MTHRLKVTTQTTGAGGRGFERVEHTATLDGIVVGVWVTDSLANWAGSSRGVTVWRYRDWRAALRRIEYGGTQHG